MSTTPHRLTLPDFIESRHAELDKSLTGVHELFGTKKRFTRQVNAPERITMETLLRLAYRIDVHPLSLIEIYNVGQLMITNDDKEQLRSHYVIKPALRDETQHYLSSPSSETQVAGANS
jgi:hypothetical protein